MANSPEQLAAWRAAAGRAGRTLPVAVQVDSGMSRLGMSRAEVARVAADPASFDGLDLRLVISHLACADEAGTPANEEQRMAFASLRALLPPAPASLSNSSGIFLGDAYHYDMVRPGAALYGVNPTPGRANPMMQAVRLQARIIQTRHLDAGATVGYGHAFHAAGEMEVATIALGYADGWPRRAATAAWADGTRLPMIGRVSMDSIVIDISALPAGRLKPGDLVGHDRPAPNG